jgi:hypothetical protein
VHVGRSASLVLSLILAVVVATTAQATLIVDQQQRWFDTTFAPLEIGGPMDKRLAQTFTVGLAGYIQEIHLPVQCESGMLIVEIRPLEGDLPDPVPVWDRGVKLAADLPAVDPPVFRVIPLEELPPEPGDRFPIGSPSFYSEVGDRLSLVLSNPTGTCTVFRAIAGDPYTRGDGFFDERTEERGWLPLDGNIAPSDDLAFKTVMDADPPDPVCDVFGTLTNPFIPRFAPLCRCFQDELLREQRCSFLHPSFFMIRRMPFPIAPGETFPVIWTLIPLTELGGDVEVKELLPSGFLGLAKKPLLFNATKAKPGREITLEYKAVAYGVKEGSYVNDSVIVSPGKTPQVQGMRTRIEVRTPK